MTQIARPISDISAGSWTDEGTADNDGNLYTSIDETSQDGDTSYIQDAGANSTCEVLLDSLTDPNDNTNHVLHVYFRSTGSAGPERLDVSLIQGTTVIEASTANTNRSASYADVAFAIAEASAANITDYTDLRCRMAASNLGGSETMRVTQAYIEIPDAVTPPSTVNVNTITLTGNPPQSALSPGAVSSLLDTLSLLANIQNISIPLVASSISINTVLLTGNIPSATLPPGEVSSLLDTLELNADLQSLAFSPGAISISLNEALLTANIQNTTLFTSISVLLDTLSLLANIQALTLLPGATSLSLNTLELDGTIQSLTVSPGAISQSLASLLLSADAQTISLSPGAVILNVSTIELQGLLPILTVVLVSPGSVALDTIILTSSPEQLSLSPGAVNIPANTITIIGSPSQTTIFVSVGILLDTLELASSAENLTVGPGDIFTLLNTLILSGSAEDIIVSGVSALAVSLSTLVLQANPQDITLTPDAISILLDTVELDAALQDLQVSIIVPSGPSAGEISLSVSAKGHSISNALSGKISLSNATRSKVMHKHGK